MDKLKCEDLARHLLVCQSEGLQSRLNLLAVSFLEMDLMDLGVISLHSQAASDYLVGVDDILEECIVYCSQCMANWASLGALSLLVFREDGAMGEENHRALELRLQLLNKKCIGLLDQGETAQKEQE
eukprot:TRINITY_DN3687_c0_g1_i2.p2 TRINITY_DN3687_c0_g1~~TRINITY_DN3687_c0_g1_i2.p2  ORF type:complete len:127 (+),score=13.40 TRINITY_DN3687_c0_g1_i2:247-627(+)